METCVITLLEANRTDSVCFKSPVHSHLETNDCVKPQLFVRYQLTNLTSKWEANSPIYIQEVSKYIITWDSESNKVLYGFPYEKCIEKKENCEDWNNTQEKLTLCHLIDICCIRYQC